MNGPQSLQPVATAVAGPDKPFTLDGRKYWRIYFFAPDGKRGDTALVKLSPDGTSLRAVFDWGFAREESERSIAFEGIIPADRITHVQVFGEPGDKVMEWLLAIENLEQLTLTGTSSGRREAARRARKDVIVD